MLQELTLRQVLTLAVREKGDEKRKGAGAFLLQGDNAALLLNQWLNPDDITADEQLETSVARQIKRSFMRSNEFSMAFDAEHCHEQYFFEALYKFLALDERPEDDDVSALIALLKAKTQIEPLQLFIPDLAYLSPRILSVIRAILKEPNINIYLLLATPDKAASEHLVELIRKEHTSPLSLGMLDKMIVNVDDINIDIDPSASASTLNLIQAEAALPIDEETFVLALISLFGHKPISIDYIHRIFDTFSDKAFKIQDSTLNINTQSLKETLQGLIERDILFKADLNTVAFNSPRKQYQIQQMAKKIQATDLSLTRPYSAELAQVVISQAFDGQQNPENLGTLLLQIQGIHGSDAEQQAQVLNKCIEHWIQNGEYENVNTATALLINYYRKALAVAEEPDAKRLHQETIAKLWEKRLTYVSELHAQAILDEGKHRISSSEFQHAPAHLQIKFYTSLLKVLSSTKVKMLTEPLGKLIFEKIQALSPKELVLPPLLATSIERGSPGAKAHSDEQKKYLFDRSNPKYAENIADCLETLQGKYQKILSIMDTAGVETIASQIALWVDTYCAQYSDDYKKTAKFKLAKKYEKHLLEIPESKETLFLALEKERDALLKDLSLADFYRLFENFSYLSQDLIRCYGVLQSLTAYLIENEIYCSDLLFHASMLLLLERGAFSRSDKLTRPLFTQLSIHVEKHPDNLLLELVYLVSYPRFEAPDLAYIQRLERLWQQAKLVDDILVVSNASYSLLKFIDYAEPNLIKRHAKKQHVILETIEWFSTKHPIYLPQVLHILAPIMQDQVMLELEERPLISSQTLDNLLKAYPDALLLTAVEKFFTPAQRVTYNTPNMLSYDKVKLILAASGNALGLSDFMLNEMLAYIGKEDDDSKKQGLALVDIFIKQELIDGLRGRLSESTGIMVISIIIAQNYTRMQDVPAEYSAFLKPSADFKNAMLNKIIKANILPRAAEARLHKIVKHTRRAKTNKHITEIALNHLNGNDRKTEKSIHVLINKIDTDPNSITSGMDIVTQLMQAARIAQVGDAKTLGRTMAICETHGVRLAHKQILSKHPELNPNVKKIEEVKLAIKTNTYSIADDETFTSLLESYQQSDSTELGELSKKEQIEFVIHLVLQHMLGQLGLDSTHKNIHLVRKEEAGLDWHVLSTDLNAQTEFRKRGRGKAKLPALLLQKMADYSIIQLNNPAVSYSQDPFFRALSSKLERCDNIIALSFQGYYVYASNIDKGIFSDIKNVQTIPPHYFALLELLFEKFQEICSRMTLDSKSSIHGTDSRRAGSTTVLPLEENDTSIVALANLAVTLKSIPLQTKTDDLAENLASLKKLGESYAYFKYHNRRIIQDQLSDLSKVAVKDWEDDQAKNILINIETYLSYDALPFYSTETGLPSLPMEQCEMIYQLSLRQNVRVGMHLSLFIEQYHFHKAVSAFSLTGANILDHATIAEHFNKKLFINGSWVKTTVGKKLRDGFAIENLKFVLVFKYCQALSKNPANDAQLSLWVDAIKKHFIHTKGEESLNIEGPSRANMLTTKTNIKDEMRSLEAGYTHVIDIIKRNILIPGTVKGQVKDMKHA